MVHANGELPEITDEHQTNGAGANNLRRFVIDDREGQTSWEKAKNVPANPNVAQSDLLNGLANVQLVSPNDGNTINPIGRVAQMNANECAAQETGGARRRHDLPLTPQEQQNIREIRARELETVANIVRDLTLNRTERGQELTPEQRRELAMDGLRNLFRNRPNGALSETERRQLHTLLEELSPEQINRALAGTGYSVQAIDPVFSDGDSHPRYVLSSGNFRAPEGNGRYLGTFYRDPERSSRQLTAEQQRTVDELGEIFTNRREGAPLSQAEQERLRRLFAHMSREDIELALAGTGYGVVEFQRGNERGLMLAWGNVHQIGGSGQWLGQFLPWQSSSAAPHPPVQPLVPR